MAEISNEEILAGVTELLKAYDEIDKAPPRAAAVTAAAMIDGRLEAAIGRRLIQDEQRIKNLFKVDGGASENLAKLRIGYLLGVYKRETYKNLKAISSIRNRFAHRVSVRDFDHPDITKYTDRLTLYKRLPKIWEDDPHTIFPDFLGKDPSPRQKFSTTARMILTYFSEDAERDFEAGKPMF